MNKKGFEMNFAWMFAIIVGAVILFLAVFVVSKFIDSSRFRENTQVASQLGILLHPVETNLDSGGYSEISFYEETRFYNNCRNVGNFGQQGIRTSVKSGIGSRWAEPGIESVYYNKYIFSGSVEEGKKLNVFSKPFNMPFKVADVIFVSSKDYCFVNPPIDIEEEVRDLGMKNVNVSYGIVGCPLNSVKVCFSAVGCDVDVNIQARSVRKGENVVYYEDSLIYGAIFADAGIYECQVKRLMKRLAEVSYLYASKGDYLSGRGCSSGLAEDLRRFAVKSQINATRDLQQVANDADGIRRRNEILKCKLF